MSAVVTFSLFVAPALASLLGTPAPVPPHPKAVLAADVRSNPAREQAVRLGDLRAGLAEVVAERGARKALLRRRAFEEAQERRRDPALLLRHPGDVEDGVGMVGDQRAQRRVHRDERDARRQSGRRIGHVARDHAAVVVPDLLLLDGDRGGVRQRRPATVRLAKVEEEGRDGLAVVDDGRLEAAHEVGDLGIGEIGLGRKAPGRLEVRRDERVQPRRGHRRVRLAEAERAPLGMSVAAPPLGLTRQREQVGPADRAIWPAERLGHRLRHRDHEGRLDDARQPRRKHVGNVAGSEMLSQQQRPARRGRSPDIGPWPVRRLVPAPREGALGVAGRLPHDADLDAASVHGGAAVPLVRQLGEHG